MPYIGGLSSRTGTIESWPGRVDALSHFPDHRRRAFCACVQAWPPHTRRTGAQLRVNIRAASWPIWRRHIGIRNPFPAGHLGCRTLARGFAPTIKRHIFLELKEGKYPRVGLTAAACVFLEVTRLRPGLRASLWAPGLHDTSHAGVSVRVPLSAGRQAHSAHVSPALTEESGPGCAVNSAHIPRPLETRGGAATSRERKAKERPPP